MFKYTTSTLTKIEDLLSEAHYVVRYEKGSFKAGYCVLKDKRVVVINKYFNMEARINCFLDIIGTIDMTEFELSDKSKQLLKNINEFQTAA